MSQTKRLDDVFTRFMPGTTFIWYDDDDIAAIGMVIGWYKASKIANVPPMSYVLALYKGRIYDLHSEQMRHHQTLEEYENDIKERVERNTSSNF